MITTLRHNEVQIQECFSSSIGEKKKLMNTRSLVMSIEIIIEFIMKLSSIVSLISFIVLATPLGYKTRLVDLWMKYEKLGEY